MWRHGGGNTRGGQAWSRDGSKANFGNVVGFDAEGATPWDRNWHRTFLNDEISGYKRGRKGIWEGGGKGKRALLLLHV